MWGRADQKKPTESLLPEDYGWKMADRRFIPYWYEGPALPTELENHHAENPTIERAEDETWSDDSDDEDLE